MNERVVTDQSIVATRTRALMKTSVSMQKSPRSKYLKQYCKLSYRPKVVKSTGVFIVLLWNFLTVSVYHYVRSTESFKLPQKINFYEHTLVLLVLVSVIFYPIAGWVADVHFGRYKTIRASLWIMWVGTMVHSLMMVITDLHTDSSVIQYLDIFTLLVLIIGLGGFQANIIQFGVDQLLDASASEIIAFVRWYVWTVFGGGVALSFLECIPIQHQNTITSLSIAIGLSLALCIDYLFSGKHLVKEPVTQNPLKLVRKVLVYAIKHKRPRMRSAFTYWEDKLPSRIDLAKLKYGGPFTTEQVEDVKTFFRLLAIIALGTISSGIIVSDGVIQKSIFKHFWNGTLFHSDDSEATTSCFSYLSIYHSALYSGVIWIPFSELVLYPLTQNCFPNVTILTKFVIALLLILLSIISLVTIDQVEHRNTNNADNAIVNVSFYWLAIPHCLYGVSTGMMFGAGIELVCAQGPYSMKGLLLGTGYGMAGLVEVIGLLFIVLPISVLQPHFIKDIPISDRHLWELLLLGTLQVGIIIIFLFVRKCYKPRKREDTLPNEQMFATAYYSH